MEQMNNNEVYISGKVASAYVFSHEMHGEKFYIFDLAVERLSEEVDVIPVIVSERLTDVTADNVGCSVFIRGQYRSYSRKEGERTRLMLCVFTFSIEPMENYSINSNYVSLNGYVCKPPVYRKTPLGREIADVLLAVNRNYGKSDYIPCILWGRNAKFASSFNVGKHICVEGRIQSRTYTKTLEDGTKEERMAFEVSVSKLEVPEE